MDKKQLLEANLVQIKLPAPTDSILHISLQCRQPRLYIRSQYIRIQL